MKFLIVITRISMLLICIQIAAKEQQYNNWQIKLISNSYQPSKIKQPTIRESVLLMLMCASAKIITIFIYPLKTTTKNMSKTSNDRINSTGWVRYQNNRSFLVQVDMGQIRLGLLATYSFLRK